MHNGGGGGGGGGGDKFIFSAFSRFSIAFLVEHFIEH